MANYTVEFSAFLPLRTEAEISLALTIHAETRAAEEEALDNGPPDGVQPEGADFMAERTESEGVFGLWIHSDEGNPYHVTSYVLRLAEVFDLRGLWHFTWAHGCDRPRLDAFGGGAAVVDLTRREARTAETGDWVEQMIDAIQGPGGTVPTIAGPA